MIDLSSRLDALTDDERMIRDAAADYCARDGSLRRVRELRGQLPSHDARAWREMAEMGWLGCRLPERLGGMALTHSQLSLLLEQYGRSRAPEPLVGSAILAGGALLNGQREALKERWLPALARGEWLPSLAWQDTASRAPGEAFATRAGPVDGGVVLDGGKRFVQNGESADAFIVSAMGPAGPGLYLVGRDAPGLKIRTHPRVDGGTWRDLELAGVEIGAGAVIASGDGAASTLARALDEARLAASAELVGLMSRAFEITVAYLKVREQFGRPIGSFQALQHRAVDLLGLVEISRAVLRQSAASFDADDDPDARARAASQAKARASDAALKVAKGCIQLHGGIGYTDEHDIGLFLKRAMVLAAWLGGAAEHRERYGRLVESTAADGDTDAAADPLRTEVRRFLAENFPPQWRFPRTRMSLRQTDAWQRRLAAKGWMAPGWPVEYGGMGLSAYDQVAMQEELDRHGVSIIPNNGV
ncbi:MAG TPA: acyl-CoA dehydrogenase family protein, partial [Quisquiliibacterium sp.]|nr:acyl-CoA dehydrogenase family protein [Quisquiliibacterium sp.]